MVQRRFPLALLAAALLPACSGPGPGEAEPVVLPVLPSPLLELPPGRLAWQADLAAGGNPVRVAKAWETGGWVVVQVEGGSVLCFRLADGLPACRANAGGPLRHEPMSDGRRLAFVTGERLFVLEPAVGRVVLDAPLHLLPTGPPCLVGESVFLPSLAEGGVIFSFSLDTKVPGWIWRARALPTAGPVAVDAGSGRQVLAVALDSGLAVGLPALAATRAEPRLRQWETPGVAPGGAGLTAAGRLAVLASSDAHVYALDGGSGSAIWVHAAGSPARGRPAVAGDRVFVRTAAGLHSLNLADGKHRWTFPGTVELAARMGESVFVTTPDGLLVRLALATGEPLQSFRPAGYRWVRNDSDETLLGWTAEGRLVAIR